MFGGGFPPGQFGDYTSFLEIAFALNILFNAWHAIPTSLTRRRGGVGKYAEKPGAASYDSVGKWSKVIVRCGQGTGLLFAFAIAAALYVLADEVPVDQNAAMLILLAVAPLPVTYLLVRAIHIGFALWLVARNLRGLFAHWRSMFILARDVHRSEELRERWMREREGRQASQD